MHTMDKMSSGVKRKIYTTAEAAKKENRKKSGKKNE